MADILGTSGNDTLSGTSDNDNIYGLAGNDVLNGNAGDDVLDGGTGADQLFGDAGDDVFNGGAGNDVLQDWSGSDTYVWGMGSGTDTVNDMGVPGEVDTVQVLSGVTPATLLVTQDFASNFGAWTLRLAQSEDQFIIQNFNSIEQIQFADGTVWDQATIQARVQQVQTGTEMNDVLSGFGLNNYLEGRGGDDTLYGASGIDALLGGMGNDQLFGGMGDDVLNGGSGNDQLYGDLGSDTYIFGVGSGTDTVQDWGMFNETDTVYVTSSVTPATLFVTQGGAENPGGLTLRLAQSEDQFIIQNFNSIEQIQFADGTVWDQATIQLRMQQSLMGTAGDDTLWGSVDSNYMQGLGGNDDLHGNEGNDVLLGGAGDDVLDGGQGDDTMSGGQGNDSYYVDAIGDAVMENVGEGSDTVHSSITYTLGSNIEHLALTGASVIDGTGNTLDNILTGNSAANTLSGGAGNDTFIVGVGDVVVENANEGTDLIQSDASFVLSANVENLTLTGIGAINGTGNELDNVLTGNSAANVLDGSVGTDTMAGGQGDDIYMVDNANDIVIENVNEGSDTISASISYALGSNVENLTLVGAAAINATGNALTNVLTGNNAGNVLDGGVGADTMVGGQGDDTYVVDNVSDVVNENLNEGADTIQSSVTYSLGSNIENLMLTGVTAINGTGNSLDNILLGNSADNVLDGGSGTDTMAGRLGNDTYIIDNVGDGVMENANEGTDIVHSSISYLLGANVENLTLRGTTAINGSGNSLNNVLMGNSAANILDGAAGADSMTGGQGDDTYVVDNVDDTVIEVTNEGIDTVLSGITYMLGNNVENLTLTGTSAINGTGNALNNVLIGNSAANTLTGGAGNDTYVIGSGDAVVEAANGGTDTVQSASSYTLGANVENLTLTGSSAINGTGNSLNNVLIGNSAANTLTGGAGNDIYVVGAGDTVVESNNNGTDTIQSAVTWTLGSNVENLTLLGFGTINGTGNSADNQMLGNAAANVLSGANGNDTIRGNAGNDTVNGGGGNDTYQFGRGEGQDLVQDGGGSSDKILYDFGINPLDLVISRQANDLRLSIHGSSDYVTVQNWYTSSSNRTETIQAGNGQTLLSMQVDQLIQAMASFSQQTGLTWDQAIDQRPQDVQAVLAASWQP